METVSQIPLYKFHPTALALVIITSVTGLFGGINGPAKPCSITLLNTANHGHPLQNMYANEHSEEKKDEILIIFLVFPLFLFQIEAFASSWFSLALTV